MDRPLDQIVEAFQQRRILFAPDRDANARELAHLQQDRWLQILDSLRRALSERRLLTRQMTAAFEHLKASLASQSNFNVVREADSNVVIGKIPIIDNDNLSVIHMFIATEPLLILGAITSEVVPFSLDANPNFMTEGPNPLEGLNTISVTLLSAAYLAAKHDINKTISSNQRLVNFDAMSTSLLARIENGQQKSIDNQAKAQNDLEDLVKNCKEQIISRKEDWDDFLTEANVQIVAAKAFAHETAAFVAATSIWQTKQARHRRTFLLGVVGLSITITALVAGFVSAAPHFWSALPRKQPDNDIPYGAVALCFVPIVALGWVLRIVARWVTNSLTLSEDAEQRGAMLDTYFHLVGDPNAKMESNDRILILNAIFRPLPGYQSEDVAPPTLLDLTKDTLSKK